MMLFRLCLSLTCHRASSDAVEKSFNRVGDDLLQILVILIDEEIKNRLKVISSSSSDSQSTSTNKINDDRSTGKNDHSLERENQSVAPPHDGCSYVHDLMLRKATKIIGHFARVGRATRPMALFPGFLG